MTIECNEINQVINQLKMTFQSCGKINHKDLETIVDLIAAVNQCSNGGANYNTLVTKTYEGPVEVVYPPNSFHSFSLMVIDGTIEYMGFLFPRGSVKNIEFTTLNQTEIKFKVNTGGKVLFEYLIEDVDG